MSDKKWTEDSDMLIKLHNYASSLQQHDPESGQELRRITDRFSELIKNAYTRRHWCNGNEK